MKDLEELLNRLIDLWWKPRGYGKMIDFVWWKDIHIDRHYVYSINDLCLLDSWLRQFVCEKWLVQFSSFKHNIAYQSIDDNMFEDWEICIMLSSIQQNKDKFLLDNISLNN